MNINYHILTTRFNSTSFNENELYRNNYNFNGCIYSEQQSITSSIIPDAPIFIIEMNNTSNKIEGIGVIKNRIHVKNFNVYKDNNLNRYVYKGKHRISRSCLIILNEHLVLFLEKILFKGKTHLKRGSGFTKIPEKIINDEIINPNKINILKEILSCFNQTFNREYLNTNIKIEKIEKKYNKPKIYKLIIEEKEEEF